MVVILFLDLRSAGRRERGKNGWRKERGNSESRLAFISQVALLKVITVFAEFDNGMF